MSYSPRSPLRPALREPAHSPTVWPYAVAEPDIFKFRAHYGLYQTAGGDAAGADSDPVGFWGSSSGTLASVASSSTARPTLDIDTPAVSFDGSDDYLEGTALSVTSGSLLFVIETGATAFSTAQAIFSAADEGSASEWFEIGITADGRLYIERNAAGTKHTLIGSSYLENATAYAVLIVYDGTDYYVQIGSTEQNPLMVKNEGTPGWFGSVTSADNVVFGGTVTSGGLVRPFEGKILAADLYSTDITS